MTRTEYLQQLANDRRTDYQCEFEIEYRGGAGWWAVPDEQRHIGDTGEYLGQDWHVAERTLCILLG